MDKEINFENKKAEFELYSINKNSINNNSINKNTIKNQKISSIKPLSLILLTIFFLFSSLAFAIPNSLTLQGKLTNLAGASQSGTYNFTFRIYDAATNGNVLWELTNHNITTDSNGVYDIVLTNIDLSFADQYYLGIIVSSDNESVPRINLTSAPYSFRANVSEALNENNSYVVTNLSVIGNATFGTGTTTLEVSTQSFNLTKAGNISLAGNLTLGDQIKFRFGQIIDNVINEWLTIIGALNIGNNLIVGGNTSIQGNLSVAGNLSVNGNNLFVDSTNNYVGIGTTAPVDTLTVIGSVSTFGSLNATYINATEIRQGANLVQTVNAVFNLGNLTNYFGDASINSSVLRISNHSNLFSAAFNLGNLTNYLGGTSRNASLIDVGNLSKIFEAAWNWANNQSKVINNASILTTSNISNLPFSNFQIFNATILPNLTINGNLKATGFVNFTNNTAFNQTLYLVNGNVGIGTTSPGRLLEVAGSMNSTQLNVSSSTNLAYASGRVGIGTTTPVETLSVSGNFSTTKTNATIGNFTVMQFNASCSGFRFGNNGGLFLSCSP